MASVRRFMIQLDEIKYMAMARTLNKKFGLTPRESLQTIVDLYVGDDLARSMMDQFLEAAYNE